jgi:hypothetical protein
LGLLAQAWLDALAKTAADTFAGPEPDENVAALTVLKRWPPAQGESAKSENGGDEVDEENNEIAHARMLTSEKDDEFWP